MTCLHDRCASARNCTRHAGLALAVVEDADAGIASRGLGELAAALRPLRSASPRRELLACGALLAERFTVDRSGDPDALRVDLALERGAGAPVALGALAVTAAREAGIALGLLAGPYGALRVAHATLAQPLVLDLDDGFAPRDVAGDEPLHRWLCAHETARRITETLRRSRTLERLAIS